MSKRDDFLQWLSSQVGVSEKPPGSNNVIYNTEYYGHEVSGPGYAWCATSQWCGLRAVGCAALYYGGQKTAYVPTLLDFYRKQGQIVTEPQPGDFVFFDWDHSGLPDHIGTVEEVRPDTLTTLEGNVEDAFRRLIRPRNDKIQAYVRLRWPDEEPQPEPEIVEPFVDVKKGSWYAKAVKWGVDNGITAGTDKTHFSPNAKPTRAQVITMLYALYKLLKGGG